MKSGFLLLLILSLCGCVGAFVNYTEPSTGPTATLTLNLDAVTVSGIYASEKCNKLPEGVFFGYPQTPTVRGQPDYKLIRKIPAKEGIVVAFHAQAIGYQKTENCSISLKFNPVDGGIYEAIARYNGQKCFAEVYKIEQVQGLSVRNRENSVQLTKRTCDLFGTF